MGAELAFMCTMLHVIAWAAIVAFAAGNNNSVQPCDHRACCLAMHPHVACSVHLLDCLSSSWQDVLSTDEHAIDIKDECWGAMGVILDASTDSKASSC